MNFGSQIKKIRAKNDLTQEQLSEKLSVSRQTISSWETDRNLPDLEMGVKIAQVFDISLDQLILGDSQMTHKLVKDGSEVRRSRMNFVSAIFFVLSGICFVSFNLIGSTVDKQGVLHEPFFLIPIGYLFILFGIITMCIYLIRRFIFRR